MKQWRNPFSKADKYLEENIKIKILIQVNNDATPILGSI